MNTKTKEMLKILKLGYLLEYWDDVIAEAEKNNLSYDKFLFDIIKKEYEYKVEVTTTNRIKRAKIPNEFTIDTYPFNEQPHLNKKRLLQRCDSLDYLEKNRNIIFVGSAGTGKTGLASSILRHSLNQGYSGHFIEFNSLMEELLSSIADRSTKKVIKKYSSYRCLVVDDLCYIEADKVGMGLFYSLIQKRYNKSCTIITTVLGLTEWDTIFNNKQLTDGLLSRLTDNGHIINFKNCKNIRRDPEVD